MNKTKKSNNTKQALITIVALLLAIAVVMGALAAFTDIFKKDNTPADKLEYKDMVNGDVVNMLYFNTERELTFDDVVVMSLTCDHDNITSSESVNVTHKFTSESANFYIFFKIDDLQYGRFQLWLYVGKPSSEKVRILLYSEHEDKENDVKRGWQFDKLDMTKYVSTGDKIYVEFGERDLALQRYTGQFISVNGAFIADN